MEVSEEIKHKQNLEKIKFEERKALLSMFYQAGFDYRKVKEYKISKEYEKFRESEEFKECEKFRKLINEESKKRNIKPLELIRQLVENNILYNRPSILKETIEFLEKKSIKKLLPKFKNIYTHSEMENVFHKVFKTERLTNKGISTIEEAGEVNIWESKDVEYIVKVDDLLKLEGRPPKVYVSQIKNLSLLMGMIQEQQYLNSTKEAKCKFMLSYYAERRGYTKEEIAKSGNFYNELKRDLLTGAYTTYRIDAIIIEGKKYTRHGIPNFYILDEPKDPKNEWIVTLNSPYSDWITKVLNREANQYFTRNHKAIEDRETTEKPYLFLFYMQLTKRKRANLFTLPLKIRSLLADMKIADKILARPKECFELLKECLVYFSKHYDPPELEQFFLYNDFHKTQTVKMPLYISEAFTRYSYNDFKGILQAIGVKDIREAYISFKRPYIKPEAKKPKHFILTQADEELIEEILDQAKEWEECYSDIPFTEEKRYKFLTDCIRYLGHEKLSDLFILYSDNMMDFLTRILKEELKEDKEAKEKLPKQVTK